MIENVGAAVIGGIALATVAWGVNMESRVRLEEKATDKGARFTEAEGKELGAMVQDLKSHNLVLEAKLDIIIKHLEK